MNGVIRLTRWCIGECVWIALSVLLAIAFVTGFVWLAEPSGGELWNALRGPVNVVRIVVLSAALWVWAYIARVISAAGSDSGNRVTG